MIGNQLRVSKEIERQGMGKMFFLSCNMMIYRSDGSTYVPCMFEYVKTRNIDVMGLRYLSGVILFHLYCVGWNIYEDVRSEMLQEVKIGVMLMTYLSS